MSLDIRLGDARLRLADARLAHATAREFATKAAADAVAAGMSEREIAHRLGVTRLTVRSWLGK